MLGLRAAALCPTSEPMPNEFFYIDEHGNKSDAPLHEPILAEGDDDAAFQALVPFLRRELKWTDAEIERVYKRKVR